MWAKIKQFFHDSETIFWARVQMLFGLIVPAAAAMNWSPLLATGLSTAQIVSLGAVLFVQGVITELARRLRSTDL